MANIQIPNLPVAVGLSGTEQIEIVQAGTSCRTTTAAIAQLYLPILAPNNYVTKQQFFESITLPYLTKPASDPNLLFQSINPDVSDPATMQFYCSAYVSTGSPLYNLCKSTYSYTDDQMLALMTQAGILMPWG